MKAQNIKKVSALISAVALASTGAAGVAPLLADMDSSDGMTTPATQAYAASAQADVENVAVSNVQGDFSYNQNAVSSASSLSKVFVKAAATLCKSLPDYSVTALAHALKVSGDVNTAFTATLADMAADAEARSLVMACACATNMPAGGAIANAEVSGVPLEVIAQRAGA